jgi:DNA invertase Pin-like site-specific DNA recombinase
MILRVVAALGWWWLIVVLFVGCAVLSVIAEAIDTATPTGRAMWQMIDVLAELERSLISERTLAGVKAPQRRGVKFGRKVELTPEQIDHARNLIDKGEARQYVADLLNVGRSTLYRALAG